MQSGSRHPVSIWVAAFAITAALQVFRGALGDTIIFVGGALLILVSTTLLRDTRFPSSTLITNKSLEWAGLVLLICLIFTPRHTFFNLAIFVLVLPVAITLAWGETAFPAGAPSEKIKATRNIWIAWAVCLAIWEFAANVLGSLSRRHGSFPTISVLVDPILKSDLGQAGFVAAWLTIGYFLLKAGVK